MPSPVRRPASTWLAVLAALSLALGAGCGASSAPAAAPLTVSRSPAPVRVAGGTMLVYELFVGDYRALGLTASRIEVRRDGPTGELLLRLEGAALDGIVIPPQEGLADRALLLLGLAIPEGASVPGALHHEVTFTDGSVARGGVATVSTASPVSLLAPVRGDRWYVGNGPSTLPIYHRNAVQEKAGRIFLPERFAVDFVQLGADGRAFAGDGRIPAEWVGYGADLVAVADGTIVSARDGVPDNAPVGSYSIPVTGENLMGNVVVLDVRDEHARFAVYAHLVPGSLRVKIGDRVAAGQVIGKLGNSGMSGAPHLHFHVCDGNVPAGGQGDALWCDGLPYVLPGFTLLGSSDFDSVDRGAPWTPTAPPQPRSGELLLDGQIVDLGP